ncbi:hypothetical protein C0971_05085 [Bacillus methanolicus]|uniref:hypothetical protein n=1 Tax=Bacillus methanolicus TaxID=1471 RepID=UPI00200F7261|nr:hypothetical protein [Bacillus methanolicus]UQD51461.1 hypothetical protein C0971_05085 [Bacillus methanolicus]
MNNDKSDFDLSLDFLTEKLSILVGDSGGILAIDLFDLFEGSNKISNYIKTIYESTNDKDELEEILIYLESELEHLHWHYKSIKKILRKL